MYMIDVHTINVAHDESGYVKRSMR